ncbi:MAG: Uma2 family endonuclease [Fimbriimonadales bacterium]|nr:Uma2 family endonuclease [Fimbriimonadales bacterium]
MKVQFPKFRSHWSDEERAEMKRAIAELRRLLPEYERTRNPKLYDEIVYWTDILPAEDGIPMEFFWHHQQMRLLIEMTQVLWRDRTDYVVGGNNFIYYSLDQAEAVVDDRPNAFRGPDFFVITGVDPSVQREKWVGWLENYKYPDLIIEILSRRTARQDRTIKKDIYQNHFKTQEYFWYNAYGRVEPFEGFEWRDGVYVPKARNERGWMWSEVLKVWVGVHTSVFDHRRFRWLRFFYPDGKPVPSKTEMMEQERQRAEQAERQLQQTQAELERLKAKLRAMGVEP